MDAMEAPTITSAQSQELLTALGGMAPLVIQGHIKKEDGREPKKARKDQHKPTLHQQTDANQVMQLLAGLVLQLDRDNQALRRQDCFVCFLQNDPQGILPHLVHTAKQWHHQMSQQDHTMKDALTYVPLRAILLQTLAQSLQQRLHKLSQCQPQDQIYQTAVQHRMLNQDGSFPFHRWNQMDQKLMETDQTPIPMDRMIRYIGQLNDLVKDSSIILKFHALKASETALMVPWMLQVAVRHDVIHVLLQTLVGSKVWGLIGMSLKPHTLQQSGLAVRLQDLMGKGPKKGRGKGKNGS